MRVAVAWHERWASAKQQQQQQQQKKTIKKHTYKTVKLKKELTHLHIMRYVRTYLIHVHAYNISSSSIFTCFTTLLQHQALHHQLNKWSWLVCWSGPQGGLQLAMGVEQRGGPLGKWLTLAKCGQTMDTMSPRRIQVISQWWYAYIIMIMYDLPRCILLLCLP